MNILEYYSFNHSHDLMNGGMMENNHDALCISKYFYITLRSVVAVLRLANMKESILAC
ncbi:hypothetical protein HUI95_20155 [Aeromonas dhakensis]|uniref:hypothetical protein n=1 Tax=Aeromonas dhakensis TaxID=196024 RepID=UPI001A907675|nr:hypothetical protein [Aeromonas dhakensis]QSR45195.1 hypothetical protein HUI95_20155 [Aeromonas dhakensis]